MAAAAFAERAAELTPDPARRARRALIAAQVKHQVGAPDAARALLAMAQAGPLDELGRARAELLRAQLAADPRRGRDAWLLLLEAASRLEPLDACLAREAYRDALTAALTAGRLATGDGMLQAAKAAWGAPQVPEPARATDLLLDGLVVLTIEGHAAGMPMMKRALSAFRNQEASAEETLKVNVITSRSMRPRWQRRQSSTASTCCAPTASCPPSKWPCATASCGRWSRSSGTTKAVLETRPIYHASDAAIRGHLFTPSLALVLRKELQDRLQAAELDLEVAGRHRRPRPRRRDHRSSSMDVASCCAIRRQAVPERCSRPLVSPLPPLFRRLDAENPAAPTGPPSPQPRKRRLTPRKRSATPAAKKRIHQSDQ